MPLLAEFLIIASCDLPSTEQDGCQRGGNRGCGHSVKAATSKKVQLQQVADSDGDGQGEEVRELERTVKRQARQIRDLERRVGDDSDSDSSDGDS